MIKIIHRVNESQKLISIPINYGVEIDLRDSDHDIIVTHDPFSKGETLENYLKSFKHNTIILNVKSEGIEEKTLEILKKYNIESYFFLDLSFPALIKLAQRGEKKIAFRYSEYEGLETILNLKGMVEWVWVDCFNKFPLDNKTYRILKKDFKLCLVSPELQGHSIDKINIFKELIKEMPFDAVCTKRFDLWD